MSTHRTVRQARREKRIPVGEVVELWPEDSAPAWWRDPELTDENLAALANDKHSQGDDIERT